MPQTRKLLLRYKILFTKNSKATLALSKTRQQTRCSGWKGEKVKIFILLTSFWFSVWEGSMARPDQDKLTSQLSYSAGMFVWFSDWIIILGKSSVLQWSLISSKGEAALPKPDRCGLLVWLHFLSVSVLAFCRWLMLPCQIYCRALEFMQVFLGEVVRGEKDLAVAAGEELDLSRNLDFPQKSFNIFFLCATFSSGTLWNIPGIIRIFSVYTLAFIQVTSEIFHGIPRESVA